MLDLFTKRLRLITYILIILIIFVGLSFLPYYGWLAFFIWLGLAYVAISTYYNGTDIQRVTAIPVAVLAILILFGLKSGYVNGLILLSIMINFTF